MRKLWLCPSGGGWRVLKKYAALWEISTDHFDPSRAVEGNLRLPALERSQRIPQSREQWRCSGRPGTNELARRVKRPPRDQLLAEIKATSYCAVGRKYGVSDNAVRKWVRFYERERERNELNTSA